MSEVIPVDGLVETYIPKRNCQNCLAMRETDCPKAPKDNQPCDDFQWGYTLEEYQTAGAILLDYVQQAAIAMGMLVDWGNEHIRPLLLINGKPVRSDTAWLRWCANLWNTTRPTLVKAWGLWLKTEKVGIQIPANVSPSTAYDIISADIDDPAERQQVLDLAADEEWTAWDVREIKGLLKRGLTTKWELPRLVQRGEYILERRGKRYRRIARVLAKAPGAGLHLLLSRGHVHQEREGEG